MTLLIIGSIFALFVVFRCAIPTRAPVRNAVLEQGRARADNVSGNVRIATYNIHGGKGADGRRDLDRIAADIGPADIVAIQEVRSGWRPNQARELGHRLGLGWLYVPTLRRWCKSYRGNGLLSRFEVKKWRTYPLPNIKGRRYRVYTIAELVLGDQVLSVLFTHLHTAMGREQQLQTVLEQFGQLPVPAVLFGDLNSRPGDPALTRYLPSDATDAIAMSLAPDSDTDRVDWILARGLEIVAGGTSDSGGSDHPFYWMEARCQRASE